MGSAVESRGRAVNVKTVATDLNHGSSVRTDPGPPRSLSAERDRTLVGSGRTSGNRCESQARCPHKEPRREYSCRYSRDALSRGGRDELFNRTGGHHRENLASILPDDTTLIISLDCLSGLHFCLRCEGGRPCQEVPAPSGRKRRNEPCVWGSPVRNSSPSAKKERGSWGSGSLWFRETFAQSCRGRCLPKAHDGPERAGQSARSGQKEGQDPGQGAWCADVEGAGPVCGYCSNILHNPRILSQASGRETGVSCHRSLPGSPSGAVHS